MAWSIFTRLSTKSADPRKFHFAFIFRAAQSTETARFFEERFGSNGQFSADRRPFAFLASHILEEFLIPLGENCFHLASCLSLGPTLFCHTKGHECQY